MKKRQLIALIIFLLIAATVVVFCFRFSGNKQPAQVFVQSENQSTVQTEKPKPITMDFVGDIMLDRGVRRSVDKNFDGDYNKLFVNTSYLKDADIAFANLEGPAAAPTTGRNVGSRFSFRMDPAGILALKNAGFDIVSFANNHVGDYTLAAFTETLSHLTDNNILYAGAGNNYADATTPRIIVVRGVKIGFLAATDVGPNWMAATDTKPGILLASDPNLPTIISNAKKQVDILVMSFHWGVEYSPANARQESLAHMVIDNGADIVVGGHPHVMEKTETYKGKPIFYSFGNFIFDQYFSPHTLQGMVGEVNIDPRTKEITATEEVSPISVQSVPQALIPFMSDMLVTKTFTP